MRNVIYESREFTKVEKYQLMLAQDVIMMKSVPDGTVLHVTGMLNYEDSEDGRVIHTLLATEPGSPFPNAYAFQSDTFGEALNDIADLYDGEFEIVKTSGVSKAGREYITCTLNKEWALSQQ